MRVTSVTCMRNEAPFILEWVAYHRMIGVNDPIIFSNDCTDGTDMMLERLDELGLIRHLPNPTPLTGGSMFIVTALKYLNLGGRLARSDWVVSLDVDEFIDVKVGRGHLYDLFGAVGDANLISLSQQNFGHGGRLTYSDALQTAQFTLGWDQTSEYAPGVNRRGTKTLTHRSAKPRAWSNHSPVFSIAGAAALHAVNGSGTRLPTEAMIKPVKALSAPHYGFDLVQLNHYALRAVDSYLLKVARGSSAHPDRAYAMGYWRKYDHNDARYTSMQRHLGDLEAAKRELLEDTELSMLHRLAVDNAHAQIADLKARPEIQELQDRIHRYARRHPGLLDREGAAARDIRAA